MLRTNADEFDAQEISSWRRNVWQVSNVRKLLVKLDKWRSNPVG